MKNIFTTDVREVGITAAIDWIVCLLLVPAALLLSTAGEEAVQISEFILGFVAWYFIGRWLRATQCQIGTYAILNEWRNAQNIGVPDASGHEVSRARKVEAGRTEAVTKTQTNLTARDEAIARAQAKLAAKRANIRSASETIE